MQRQQRLGRLSLTRRLTLFFTVVAAIVVLGLGLLFLAETQRHFVVLDLNRTGFRGGSTPERIES